MSVRVFSVPATPMVGKMMANRCIVHASGVCWFCRLLLVDGIDQLGVYTIFPVIFIHMHSFKFTNQLHFYLYLSFTLKTLCIIIKYLVQKKIKNKKNGHLNWPWNLHNTICIFYS